MHVKRSLSPPSPSSQNHKRIRTDPIVIEDDSDDDDLPRILAQIKQQEESEKLAKQLQEEWAPAGSSSNAIVIEDDDEAFARQLAKEWGEAEANNHSSGSKQTETEAVVPRSPESPKIQHRPSYQYSAEERTPTEIMSFYRSTFTVERPCTKCGESVQSPRGYVCP